MFKTILHHMGLLSLEKLFNLKNESLQHNLRDSSKTLPLPKPRFDTMTELLHGTIFLKSSEKTK